MRIVRRILCLLGQHGIVIRDGVARCDFCGWSEPLPPFDI